MLWCWKLEIKSVFILKLRFSQVWLVSVSVQLWHIHMTILIILVTIFCMHFDTPPSKFVSPSSSSIYDWTFNGWWNSTIVWNHGQLLHACFKRVILFASCVYSDVLLAFYMWRQSPLFKGLLSPVSDNYKGIIYIRDNYRVKFHTLDWYCLLPRE